MTTLTTENHEKFRLTVREFAEKEILPIASKLDENETFSTELTAKMGQFGLFGMTIPEQYGGKGTDTLSYIIAVEEISRIDGSQAATLAAHNSLGVAPINEFGTEEQKKKFIPGLCTGEKLWSFGLTETNAGSDARGVETTAELKNDNWIINGSKRYITNGSTPISAGITAMVITGERNGKNELSTILVESDREGYEKSRMLGKLMWRAADTARINFHNIQVPESHLLGEKGKGLKQMLHTLDGGRLSIAAMGLGLAQGAFEEAVKYAKKRRQFGKAIAEFQHTEFKLAEMATKIELARNTLYNACHLKDQKKDFGKEAAMAKLYCSEIAKEAADDSLQIHGGYGLFKHTQIERFYRDQRLLQIGEGTSEILKLIIARHII